MGAHSHSARGIPRFTWGSRVAAFCATGFFVLGLIAFVGLGLGPHTGAYKTTTMLSGSMSPGIPVGAVLVAVPKPISEIHPGEVVTFEAPVPDRHVVTHRVTEAKVANGVLLLRTKGDANAKPDPWLAQLHTDKVWVVTTVIPWAGKLVQQLRNPLVHKATVLVLPAIIVLVGFGAIWGRRGAVAA